MERTPRPGADCAVTVRTGNEDLLVLRYRDLVSSERRRCLDTLLAVIADVSGAVSEDAARGIEALARARLVDDAATLRPLIDCVRRHLDQLGMFCNRALAALTRHGYGEALFARSLGAPEFTGQNRDRVVADWTELERQLERGRLVFDAYLEDETLRAIRAVGATLTKTLAESLPNHPVVGYLRNVAESRPSILRGEGEKIFHFSVGDTGSHTAFPTPANWPNRGVLRGIRVLFLRPGVAQPSSAPRIEREIDEFPSAAADYREVFRALDLEVRFQIVTSNVNLGPATIAAVRESLTGLREADAIARRAARSFSIESMRGRCADLAGVKPTSSGPDGFRDCRLSEVGELGVVDGATLYYALYCLLPHHSAAAEGTQCGGGAFNARYHRARGVAVFSRAPRADMTLVFDRASPEIGMNIYDAPVIVRHPAGVILHIPIAVDGTGHFNASEYYVREAGGGSWERIESEEWQKDLPKHLPAGLEIWKGIWPDVTTLRAEAGLYRRGDGNCCPTGGVARIQLAIRTRRFVLESVVVGR